MPATVALVIDLPGEGLTRGQIDTVVEHFTGGEAAELVEFADGEGGTYAMVPVKPERLVVLHRAATAFRR